MFRLSKLRNSCCVYLKIIQYCTDTNIKVVCQQNCTHCIDYRGFNVRSSYSSLGLLKNNSIIFYGVTAVALTATATDRTVNGHILAVMNGRAHQCSTVIDKDQLTL